MLKGIDPLLSGELLKALDELGHGDTVVVCDRNFPAYRGGAPVIRVDTDAVAAVSAILSVFPREPGIGVHRMMVDEEPATVLPRAARVLELAGEGARWSPSFRSTFYTQASQAGLVVLTRETEPFANFIFTKGVVAL